MSAPLDAADLRILEAVQVDGALTTQQLSERVHMSANACWRRLKRLEEDGYILRRVAVLDADRLGLGISAFVTIRLADADPASTVAAEDLLDSLDAVAEVSRISGELGYIVRVVTTDMSAFDAFLREVQAKLRLRSVDTVFVTRSLRNRLGLPLSLLRQRR